MITATQRRVIDDVVSIFETGRVVSPASYGTVAILADNAGISYGKHQVTAASNLGPLLELYDERNGLYAGRIRPYLPLLYQTRALRPDTPIPDWVENLLELLRAAGADPIMQGAQDDLFDRAYWIPASTYATSIGLVHALSHLGIYDTWVQSGGGRVEQLRSRFPAAPPSKGGDERTWTTQFLGARGKWLSEFTTLDKKRQALIRSTVYRVDALLRLVAEGAWDLTPPLTVRGVRITGA